MAREERKGDADRTTQHNQQHNTAQQSNNGQQTQPRKGQEDDTEWTDERLDRE